MLLENQAFYGKNIVTLFCGKFNGNYDLRPFLWISLAVLAVSLYSRVASVKGLNFSAILTKGHNSRNSYLLVNSASTPQT